MPTYNFRNPETQEEFEIVMKMSELDKYKADNPQLVQFLTKPPALAYGSHNFNSKVPDWHKDNMKEMKKIHPKGDYGTLD